MEHLGHFAGAVVLKGIIIAVIAVFCRLSGIALALLIVGAVMEAVAAQLLGEVSICLAFKEILYYAGLLMQIITMVVVSVPFFSLSDSDMNFIKAIALGWLCITAFGVWLANGNEGAGGYLVSYGVSVGVLIIDGLLSAMMSLGTLLIVNTVFAGIAVALIVICRLAMGSNLEY